MEIPAGHRIMRPVDPPGRRSSKAHVVYTEWDCECGERTTDPKAHRSEHREVAT